MTIRFHLDEHIHPGIAAGLRAHGVDVTTTAKAGLRGSDDPGQIAFALKENRVIATHDDDYLRHSAQSVEHAGFAYCHREKYALGEHLRMLLILYECYTAEEMHGRIEFV